MGNTVRMYDENLVRNIMITTCIELLECDYLNREGPISKDDIYDFIQVNGEKIIDKTIKKMDES